MRFPHRILVLDAETLGLFGKPYAFGWVAGYLHKDDKGVIFKEDWSGYWWFNPVKGGYFCTIDMEWAEAHVLKHLEESHEIAPHLVFDELRTVLSMAALQEATVWAECGSPCESVLLREDRVSHIHPYPLHEIATVRLLAGIDPTRTDERLPEEEPKHHPEKDARQSARLLAEALSKVLA